MQKPRDQIQKQPRSQHWARKAGRCVCFQMSRRRLCSEVRGAQRIDFMLLHFRCGGAADTGLCIGARIGDAEGKRNHALCQYRLRFAAVARCSWSVPDIA
eukprot:463279-Rhodomonas_salina.1